MANPKFVLKAGGKEWKAFFDGQLSLGQVVLLRYGVPIAEEVEAEMKQVQTDTVGLLNATTTGWAHRPEFISRVVVDLVNTLGIKVGRMSNVGARVTLTFEAVNSEAKRLWDFVDRGTALHRIPRQAKTKRPLMPMRPYSPHTTPTGIGGSGTHSAATRFARQVTQSITARDFTGKINDYWAKGEFRRRIDNAIKRAKRRIG